MNHVRQKLVTHVSLHGMYQEVNGLLAEGWRVVPGSIYAVSLRAVPGPNSPPEQISPNGVRYVFNYFAVLERQDDETPIQLRLAAG